MLFNFLILITINNYYFSLPLCSSGENYCSKCNPIAKLCSKCEKDIYTPNNYGGCDIIKKCNLGNNYCLECEENNSLCKKCEIGYFPDEYGGCSYSDNCELSFHGKCLKCKKNYVLVGIENYSNEGIIICKSLNSDDFQNCTSIDSLHGKCQQCKEGYYLNIIDKKCTKTENCTKSFFGICKQCINGYYLDKKENKCKKQNNENFEYCKETMDSIKCNKCDDGYYLDEDGKCVETNFCAKKGKYGKCEKCIEGYYPTDYKSICTTTRNCYFGNKHSGICEICKDVYYMDYNDGKCKSNLENNDFKYCLKVVNNSCIECSHKYNLANNNKCSKSKNCDISEYGICLKCKENYYLGLDNMCTNIEHCIYSEDYECLECEDDYYYNKYYKVCELGEGNFTNCKYSDINGEYCERCHNDFYLNETNYLCYSNKENDNFYKCAINYANSDICDICIEGYHLGYIDKKCSKIEGCDISENENKCLECDSDYYCLNIKTGKCEKNDIVTNEEKKYLYKCNKTNIEGNGCEICLNDYTLNNDGLCVDNIHCEEEKNGICIKCEEDYCLNNNFGCVEIFFDKCLECNDISNLEKCTKCYDGYVIDKFDTCTEIL